MAPVHVLVTGATGFLGSHITRELVRRGSQVRVLRRSHSPGALIGDLGVEHAIGDLFDPPSLGDACRGMEAVVHCAAEMDRRSDQRLRLASHLEGTRNLLAAARGAQVRRFVYTSSVAALGFPDHPPSETDAGVRPMDETHLWRGDPQRWPYGHTKHLAEQVVSGAGQDGMETVILNPSLVIGPGDRNHVSNLMIWHMLHGRIPPLVGGGLNVVDVADVAEGAAQALVRGRPGQRHLLCGENWTLRELLLATAAVVDCSPPRWRLPLVAVRTLGSGAVFLSRWLRRPLGLELLRAAGLYFYYDGSRSRRELGLGPARPYEPAAAASAAWYRQTEGL